MSWASDILKARWRRISTAIQYMGDLPGKRWLQHLDLGIRDEWVMAARGDGAMELTNDFQNLHIRITLYLP